MKINEIITEGVNPNQLKKLAVEFQRSNKNKLGNCADHAKAFSAFLTEKGIQNKIIDAREYKDKSKGVGNSNHVLAAVGDIYADFTWYRFDKSKPHVFLGKVSDLRKVWKIVNTYNDYNDFLTNFSKKQVKEDEESYQPPELHTGDKILKGKFKNSPAEIKGFKKDKHNQPVLKTNKGDVQLFKPRVSKLI